MTLPITVAELVIDAPGQPVQQGSFMAVVRGGRAIVVPEKNNELKRWRKTVADCAAASARLAGWTVADCAVTVTIDFFLPRPASVTTRRFPSVRPDLDKLARAVLDSLTGTVLADDARVVDLHVRKRYAVKDIGARITVRAL